MISGCVQQSNHGITMSSSTLTTPTHRRNIGGTAKQSAVLKSFVSGASSGIITCVVFQPMDLVKTRLQMTSSMTSSLLINNGGVLQRNCIVSTITNVIRSESYRGLWNGLRPSLYRTVPGVGMYFTTLNLMKNNLCTPGTSPTLLQNMAFGFTARSFVGTVMLPIAVIKTRYESGRFHYRTVSAALSDIWRKEGVRGLFSGWGATIARDAPYSGLYFMLYSKQKEMMTSYYRNGRALGVWDNFACGLSSGVMACLITQPADVIKTQMQLHPGRHHSNLGCVVAIVKGECGVGGLVRGFVPRTLRKSLISAFSWTLFEQIMKCK